jgi:hypothetical protein
VATPDHRSPAGRPLDRTRRGIDGAPVGDPVTCPGDSRWAWRSVVVTLDGGEHEVELRQREGGVMIDALTLVPTAR